MFLSTFFPHRRLNKKKLGNVCCCRSIKICLYLFLIFYSPQKLYYWGCIATKKNPSGQTKFSFCPTTSIHGWYLWTKNVFFRLFGQETVSGDTILYIYIYRDCVFYNLYVSNLYSFNVINTWTTWRFLSIDLSN